MAGVFVVAPMGFAPNPECAMENGVLVRIAASNSLSGRDGSGIDFAGRSWEHGATAPDSAEACRVVLAAEDAESVPRTRPRPPDSARLRSTGPAQAL